MKLWVNVLEGGDAAGRFQVNVGHGRQTFRWLAVFVRQRLNLGPMPVRVDTARGALATKYGVVPSERIKDVCADCGDVFVSVAVPEKDAVGAIASTPWQDEAFRRDPSAAHRRRMRLLEFDKKQKTKMRLARLRKAAVGVGSSVVLQQRLFDGNVAKVSSTAELFERDWLKLQCLVMVPADDRDDFKDVLSDHYTVLRDVFRWYSNFMGKPSSAVDAFALDRAEWEAFISDCRVVTSTNYSQCKPSRMFQRAKVGLLRAATKDEPIATIDEAAQLDRVQFIDAVCLLAATVHSTASETKHGFVDDLPVLRPSVMLAFLKHFIVPRRDHVMGSSDVRRQLVSRDVARQVVREMDMLKAVYQEYCEKGLSRRVLQESTPGMRTLGMRQFKRLLVDSSLFYPRNMEASGPLPSARAPITARASVATAAPSSPVPPKASDGEVLALPAISAVKKASDAFKSAVTPMTSGVVTIRPGGDMGPGGPGAGGGRELSERDVAQAFLLATATDDTKTGTNKDATLTFAEFIESLLRLALSKWQGDAMPTHEKLALVIDAIAIGHGSSSMSNLGELTSMLKRLANVESKATSAE